MRKIALLNYLRLAYAEVNQHGSLWFKFNDQMQKASKEPLLFALASDNMEKLINFPKNVLLASTFLEARDVFMFGEHEKDALLDDKQRFLAIFCTIEPNLDRECLRRVLGTPNSTGVDASTLESSELFSRIRKQMQFLFALPFTVPTSLAPRVFIPGRLDEGAIKHRNDVVFPVSVYDWLIIDHVDQFKLPECVGGLLNQLMKYRISDSTATGCVCLLFHFDPGETAIVPDPANFSEIPCQSVGYGISSIWWMASGSQGNPKTLKILCAQSTYLSLNRACRTLIDECLSSSHLSSGRVLTMALCLISAAPPRKLNKAECDTDLKGNFLRIRVIANVRSTHLGKQ